MITETYKGRKIRIVKGRGNDFGYSRVTLNGTELGKWQGDESKVQGRIRGSIDAVASDGINGNKYGAEWYAPGTFEVCENGHPKEISGECLHSYCIERRPAPAATESATQRPTMKRINVTPKMVEALENTIEINGKRAMIMSHPKTQAALAARGLADENGYLTDQGRFVARLVSVRDTPRAWSRDMIEAGTRTWLSDQKRHAATEPVPETPKTIKRVVNGRLVEMPAHREAAAYIAEATPEQVTEYSVKIWYRSGAYEGAPHCPEELARKIFADAVQSAGVEFAELHGPSGMLVESKPPALDYRDAACVAGDED